MSLYHFRLYMKPSALGPEIVARLTAPSAHQQADARRWLELGYAAEKAGLRLEGEDLRFPSIGLAGQPVVPVALPGVQLAAPSPAQAPADSTFQEPVTHALVAVETPSPPAPPEFSQSALARNLRGLSQ